MMPRAGVADVDSRRRYPLPHANSEVWWQWIHPLEAHRHSVRTLETRRRRICLSQAPPPMGREEEAPDPLPTAPFPAPLMPRAAFAATPFLAPLPRHGNDISAFSRLM